MKRLPPALALWSLALIVPADAGPRETAAPARSPCPPGFTVLQNGDTCVRISGRVRADAAIGSPGTRASDSFGTQASGRIQLDVRKQTEYGPLRAVIRAGSRTP